MKNSGLILDPDQPKLVLTGGGTSGHVNPALAMGQAFARKMGGAQQIYFGIKGRAEEVIVPKAGLPILFIPSAPWASPRRPLALAKFILTLLFGVIKACWLLLKIKPHYILATGGYAAAPTVLAQALLSRLGLTKAKVVLHEANSVLGKLNRLMAKKSDYLFLTFPSREAGTDKAELVGYPVRTTVSPLASGEARANLNLDLKPETKLILIFGGSQGARTLNRAVAESLGPLQESGKLVFILHGIGLGSGEHKPWAETQTYLAKLYGPDWAERFKAIYRPEVYFHDMASAYGAADLVVCRAGAGAIHEISALGKPAILVPKPNLPGDHQVQNARTMTARGAAQIIYEDLLVRGEDLIQGVDGRFLAGRLLATVFDEDRLAALADRAGRFMSGDAARAIAGLVLEPEKNGHRPPEGPTPPPPPTHLGLLKMLALAHQRDPADYDPASVINDPAELSFFRQRSALLLVHPSWQMRNLGIKLVGLLKDAGRLEHLGLILKDTTPAGRLQRLFGGDLAQVGFIRRNAYDSLMLIDRPEPAVERALIQGLKDGYYEARSHAAAAAGHFGTRLTGGLEFQAGLIQALADKSFEVVTAAALALGEAGLDGQAVEALVNLRMHRYWQVRRAALRGLARLHRRGLVQDTELLRSELTGFVTTATDFTPRFALKAAYKDTLEAIGRTDDDRKNSDKGGSEK